MTTASAFNWLPHQWPLVSQVYCVDPLAWPFDFIWFREQMPDIRRQLANGDCWSSLTMAAKSSGKIDLQHCIALVAWSPPAFSGIPVSRPNCGQMWENSHSQRTATASVISRNSHWWVAYYWHAAASIATLRLKECKSDILYSSLLAGVALVIFQENWSITLWLLKHLINFY